MADIQDELEDHTGDLLWSLGNGLVRGILFQVVPDANLTVYERIVGEARKPFWSISSFKAEQMLPGQGVTTMDAMVRPVTVALFSEKANVQQNHATFRAVRTAAFRKISQQRKTLTDGSFVMKATIQPGARVETAAWMRSTGFVSSFDVMWQTCERFEYQGG